MARTRIGKKLRFEVFKRDSFRCQYCGRSAPEVVLHADHIKPVKDDGPTDLLNLVTACRECNLGKGARRLDDASVVKKQTAQLRELNARREQLEMLLRWREGLAGINDRAAGAAGEHWTAISGWGLSPHGQGRVRDLLRRFGLAETLEAMDISSDRYIARDDKGATTQASVSIAFSKIGGVCYNRRIQAEAARGK